ncbi:NADP-dependent oxidoreductase [Streptomyces sp. Tu 2975]|uniref:NADP-dependent oxidoreductase n=1 Tax=Streptomyces sp. Tu 2975 TaxID=2676871 RepID=UPI0013582416|nr:NADP-dependent oxidoreductase [Streptomyces sp. Tu 2975]QIP83654.1 NADP-dependent oxidoreductase [Streptomyces sp. Tu 2975]
MNGTTMRAITVPSWGGPETLTPAEVPRPVPGPTEILVRVHAAGVNPVDWKTRATGGFGMHGEPPVLGYDVSGVVEQVGPGVTLYRPGDEVFGMPEFPRQAGGYAEYVTGPARHFAPKPAKLGHVEAAALPLAGLTAWQALVETAGLTGGQRVLIHAAAGGVGHLAVQIASARGAHVVGTAREDKHALLKELGADEVIDYTRQDFVTALGRTVDVVLDSIGGDYGPRSLAVLRDGGTLVTLPSPDEVPADAGRGVRTGFTLVEPDSTGMRALAGLVEAGLLRPVVETVLPLERAADAHRLGEAGRTRGKIVLSVRED